MPDFLTVSNYTVTDPKSRPLDQPNRPKTSQTARFPLPMSWNCQSHPTLPPNHPIQIAEKKIVPETTPQSPNRQTITSRGLNFSWARLKVAIHFDYFIKINIFYMISEVRAFLHAYLENEHFCLFIVFG